jgi:hypothetical protein
MRVSQQYARCGPKKRTLPRTTRATKKKRKQKDMAVYTLQEQWDIPTVRQLVQRLPSEHRDLATLQHVLAHADPLSGLLSVDYHWSQKRQSGRLYASNSCQRLSRPVRSFCTQTMYIDLDIRKSFPRMLQHICQNNGLNPVNLGNYITKGDQVVQQILNEQQQGNLHKTQGRALPPLLGEDVKKAFLVSLHCGSYRNSVTQGCRVDILDEFATEIRQVAMKLYELPSYSSVRAHVEAQKGEDENRLGSFISLICQDQESKVIEALRECLGEQGFVVRVNMYDGLLVDKENAPRLCDEECLESLGTQSLRPPGVVFSSSRSRSRSTH